MEEDDDDDDDASARVNTPQQLFRKTNMLSSMYFPE
jgi:hypothetical protein